MYNKILQMELNGYIEKKKISQAKLAPMIGISAAALSQWRNSKYENGNISDTEEKISEFLKREQEKELKERERNRGAYRSVTGYVPTSISEDIYKLISICHFEKGMFIAHGDAGIGKTKGASKYVKENPNATIYIQATPSSGTLGNILKLIAMELKINTRQNNLMLAKDIKETLEKKDMIIIIDEAQHLKYAALEEIRTLSDPNDITGSRGTGIFLIGNSEIYNKMMGKQEARFAQIFSRVRLQRYYSTSNITKDDIKTMFPKVKEEDMIKFLHGIASSKWGLRGAVNVYNNAISSENLTIEGLKNMAISMGVGAF